MKYGVDFGFNKYNESSRDAYYIANREKIRIQQNQKYPERWLSYQCMWVHDFLLREHENYRQSTIMLLSESLLTDEFVLLSFEA